MLLPDLLQSPRTAKLADCSVPGRIELSDDIQRLGCRTKPYHLLLPHRKRTHRRNDIACHVCEDPPPRSLIKVNRDTLVVCPELLFIQLAARQDIDDVELVLIGHELCGTYVLNDSWDGFTNIPAPATSTAKIARLLQKCSGFHGAKRARRVLKLIHDGSNSPMESILAVLLTLPARYGGRNLGYIRMNQEVTTSVGSKWVDILFPRSNAGIEYKGRRPHSIERVGRDDRRQNKLVGSGITIINVWYEDLLNEHLFEQLVADISRLLGIRRRKPRESALRLRKVLRAQLLPALLRYSNQGG